MSHSSPPPLVIKTHEDEWLLSNAIPGHERFNLGSFAEPFVTVAQLKEIRRIRDDARTGVIATAYTITDSNDTSHVCDLPDVEDEGDMSFQYAIGYQNLFHVSNNFLLDDPQWKSRWLGLEAPLPV
jgi:hypothetical protein